MGRPFTLLIIDDNKEILDALCDFFKKNKYDVIPASDGLDGLKSYEAKGNEIDLVITDIVMPNISGVAVISIMKKKDPDLPVIAITGWGKHPEALAAEVQADVVLEKPFELSELEKLVKDMIN